MTDIVQSILEMSGLNSNSIQVFEMDGSKTATLLYPNFFTARDEKIAKATEADVINVLIDLVYNHLEDVKRDLELLQRAKKEYYFEVTPV